MVTDKIRKYVLPNIPYLFICWFCLKIGTAYRLAAGADFGEKLLGLGQTIGAAFADFAPGLVPFDWLVGVVGALAFRLLTLFLIVFGGLSIWAYIILWLVVPEEPQTLNFRK